MAQLYAWVGLAVLNQFVILFTAPRAGASVRLWHHAYDFAALSLLGWLSLGGVAMARRAFEKSGLSSPRWLPALGLGAVCIGVSLLMVDDDVANLAARYEIPIWLAAVPASLAFGAVLGATVFLRRLARRSLRALLLAAGVAGWLANAWVLEGDYWTVHFMLGWLSALLIGHAIEGVAPNPKLGRAGRWALGSTSLALSVLALAVPPRPAVVRRSYATSSSIVAPFAAQLRPEGKGVDLHRVPREWVASPWFQDRRSFPPVKPTGALELPRPRVVLLLVVDSVRADVLGKSKHRRRLPVLSALSKNSAYFSEARAPGSSTAASMASLFTGRYISELYWSGPARLEEPAPRLAEMLSEAGVQTVSLHGLRRISVASGIGRGFSSEVMRKRRASQLVDEVIDITRKSKGSLFLYAHFAEPHAPYAGKGRPFQRYLREVRRVDKELGRLFDFLSTSGLQKNSVVIVTSDHGEAFGEHGMNFHARLVYEEVLRVPLLIHGPGIAARTIEQPVTLIDLGPTVLDLFELPTPGVFKGQSLAPLLAGGSRALDRPLASEASRGIQTLLLPSGLKVIHHVRGRTVEVYDLGRDPAERVNLLETGDPKVASAVETTRLFFEVHRLRRPGYKPPRPF